MISDVGTEAVPLHSEQSELLTVSHRNAVNPVELIFHTISCNNNNKVYFIDPCGKIPSCI